MIVFERINPRIEEARAYNLEVGEVRVGQYTNVPEGIDLRLIGVLEPFLETEDATPDDDYLFALGRLDLRLNGETVNSIMVTDDAPILPHLLLKTDARQYLDAKFDEVHNAGLANEAAVLELAQLSAELGPEAAVIELMRRYIIESLMDSLEGLGEE